MKVTRTGVINDLHIPFHDLEVVRLCLDAFLDIKINRLVLNGDVLDFYHLGQHGPKSPHVQEMLENEIEAGIDFFDFIQKNFVKKGIEVVFISGNHENRLDRFIIAVARPFWNILTIEKMFPLDGIKIVPYNQEYQLEKTNLRIQHSPPSYSKNGAMVSLEQKLDTSFIYGCSHRLLAAHRTGASGEVYSCYFNGWLGSVDLTDSHKEVFSYVKGHSNWQQGCSLVTVTDGKFFHVEQARILNRQLCIGGRVFYR